MNAQVFWQPGVSLEDIEKQVILKALSFFQGNKLKTANSLGVSVRTIDNKLTRYQSNAPLSSESESHVESVTESPTQQQMPLPKRKKI